MSVYFWRTCQLIFGRLTMHSHRPSFPTFHSSCFSKCFPPKTATFPGLASPTRTRTEFFGFGFQFSSLLLRVNIARCRAWYSDVRQCCHALVNTTEPITKQSTLRGDAETLVFMQCQWSREWGSQVKCTGLGKIGDFRPISRRVPEIGQDGNIVTVEG